MDIVEFIGLLLLVLGLLLIGWVAVRRRRLIRAGAIDLCWRDRLEADGRGWYLGLATFEDGSLYLYRSFSVRHSPNRTLDRARLQLGERRAPSGTEQDLLPVGAVIIRCIERDREFELAMTDAAVTGVLSWIESLPPGRRTRGVRKL